MEDNVYDDLENYERLAEYDELKEENARLHKCVSELEQKISQLTEDNAKMTERLANIERNFAALLNTAKAEIDRKTEMIATLNMEKDQLIFRHIGNRNNPLNRRYVRDFERQPQPTKRKLDRPPSAEKKIPRLETQRDVRDTEITSERFEEKMEDENRNPTVIRQDSNLIKSGMSMRPDTPRFSSGDESYGSNNHLVVSTHPWNSPEYLVPETTKEEHINVVKEMKPLGPNVHDKRKTKESRSSVKVEDKYKKNLENKTLYTEKEDLRYPRRLDHTESNSKSFKKSSRETDGRSYENSRFERIKSDGRIPRPKYREEPRHQYNKSRTYPRHDKFDRCRRSRSQSPSLSLGSRNDRRPSSRHSRETHAHSTNGRELRKRSFSPHRIRRRSIEKHWHDKTEHRRDRSYERSHSRNREDHVMISQRQRTQFDHESIEVENAKRECSREDTYCRTNQKYDVNEQEKIECVKLPQTDHTAERYYRDKNAGMLIKLTKEPNQATWPALVCDPNKVKCRTYSYSNTLNSSEMSADVRICQSPDEADGGYRGAPSGCCVIIPEKGLLTVYDDPRLYNETYFHYEDIERHKHSKHSDVKELKTLNIRNRTVYLRLPKYEDKSEVAISPPQSPQQTTISQETTIPQVTLVPRDTTIPQETVLPREPTVPEMIKQQNTIIPQHTTVSLETSKETKPKIINDLSDEAIKQIYMDIDSHTSEASLESGELEDSFCLTEKVERPSKLMMELKSPAPKEENIESTNPEPSDATVKHEVAIGSTKTPSAKKTASPIRKNLQGYKIPKVRNSKQGSEIRKESESKCINLITESNKRNKLEINYENTITDSKSETNSSYSNVNADTNPKWQNEKLNTKANNNLTLLVRSMNKNLEEQGKSSKKVENKAISEIQENTVKYINKNSESCERTNKCENNSKSNMRKDSKGHKENSKKSAKDLTKLKSSVKNHQTEVAEVVKISAHEVKQSHKIDNIGKEKDSSIMKESITCDIFKKHSDHQAENKMEMDCDDIKLSDLRKQKDLELRKTSKDAKSKTSYNLKKESSSGKRSSKKSKHIDNYVKSSVSPLISPEYTLCVSESSTTIIEDLKTLKNTSEHKDISENTSKSPETEKKRASNKHKSKKEIKNDLSSFRSTSKSEDEHKRTQNEDIHNEVADKADKEIFTNKMIDLFGENSLITPEDLQDARDKSFQTPKYPENEVDAFMDEKFQNIENDLSHPENTEIKITLGTLAHHEQHYVTLLKEKITENITTVSRKEENSIEKKMNEINVEDKIKYPSKGDQISEIIMNSFEQASTTPSSVSKQGQNELGNTENITPEQKVQHNLQAWTKSQDPTLSDEEVHKPNSKVNQISRDMPSIFGLRDDEKHNLNGVSTGNLGNYIAEHCSNYLLKGYKNNDSDTHTDSDCEPPRFLTSTPNPNMSPPHCQKVMCIHSPVKETSRTDISEKSNTVTEPREDSMQSRSSVQANVSQPQENEVTVVSPPTQRIIIVKRRRVIVKKL